MVMDGDGWWDVLGVLSVFSVLNALKVVMFERMISYGK
jgi:hypothetical protein